MLSTTFPYTASTFAMGVGARLLRKRRSGIEDRAKMFTTKNIEMKPDVDPSCSIVLCILIFEKIDVRPFVCLSVRLTNQREKQTLSAWRPPMTD